MEEPRSETHDYVPPWWERGRHAAVNRRFDSSPSRVLAFYALLLMVSIAIIVQLIVDPHAALRGYRVPGSVVAAFVLIPLIVFYAPRAWRARGRRRD